MRRRLWLSLGALALGAGLLATAQLAGAARGARQGGIFRVGASGASVQIDPQLGYVTTAWWLEDATAATLFTWSPRAQLVPEVAASYAVSNRARTYTFALRRGFRFSDGAPVTARSFSYAIRRLRNKQLASPGAAFASGISRVVAKGQRLVIRLTAPDPALLSRLALPFFQATSTKLPLDHEVTGPYPSAGRYAFTRNDINVLTSIRRNPYGMQAPRGHLDGVDIHWNQDANTVVDDVEAGRLDEVAGLVASRRQALADRYGVNMGRFQVRPTTCTDSLALNVGNALFHNNPSLRRAVNYAVDRTDYLAPLGPYAGTPWSHLLTPGVPGALPGQPYPAHAALATAARLARGHLRGGKITVYVRSSGTAGPVQGQSVRRALLGMGFQPGNVTMKSFSGGNIYTAMGVHPTDWDLSVGGAWCSGTRSGFGRPDPAELVGGFARTSAEYRRRFEAAERLRGSKRLRALGRLDLEITRKLAPTVVMGTRNVQFLFSDRVAVDSLAYQPSVANWSIASLALK